MKKILFALLCTCAVTAQSKEVSLKIRYIPQTLYTVTQNMSTNMSMTFTGPEDVMAELKSNGIENPTVQKSTNESVIELSTGKLSKEGDFPVEMRFVSTSNESLKKVLGPDAIMHGRGTTDGFPVFDSISGVEIDHKLKDLLLQTMQSLLSQIKYPEEKIKVGESVSLKTPISLPIASVVLTIDLTITYTLKSINGNIANYDMDMVCTLNGTIEGHNMQAGGGGKGTMSYDTNTNYYKGYDMDLTMQASFEEEGVGLHLKMDQKTSATAEIKSQK